MFAISSVSEAAKWFQTQAEGIPIVGNVFNMVALGCLIMFAFKVWKSFTAGSGAGAGAKQSIKLMYAAIAVVLVYSIIGLLATSVDAVKTKAPGAIEQVGK
jgi:hypothetical protein